MTVDLVALRRLAEQAIESNGWITAELEEALDPGTVLALIEAVEAAQELARHMSHEVDDFQGGAEFGAALAPFQENP